MNLNEALLELKEKYDVLNVCDLDQWGNQHIDFREQWLLTQLKSCYCPAYENNQRLVFTLIAGDFYEKESATLGVVLKSLQFWLNQIDISNYFVIVLTNEPEIDQIKHTLKQLSKDPVDITIISVSDACVTAHKKIISKAQKFYYQQDIVEFNNISVNDLSDKEKFLLMQSKTFCMYPWTQLHAYPAGDAYPCCNSDANYPMGNCKTQTLKEIWYDYPMQKLRQDMLLEKFNPACRRCYELEENKFISPRISANKKYGHHIKKLEETPFEIVHWDIRFSNLCNLKCRSCGHIFSSNWYQDQAQLAGNEWKEKNTVLTFAGRTETDMWEQLEPHLEFVEEIIFAGGEPLLMEEHYNILDELVQRGKFDVKLYYSTNFTQTKLTTRSVFDYWNKFKSIEVSASLDDLGNRAEYIRKGTVWSQIEKNRKEMMEVCPNVGFYIKPTLSILNAWNLPDFHRYCVEQGFIRPQDFHPHVLQEPLHYRIDIAPAEYKERLKEKYQNHIHWLADKDPLRISTGGFQSAIDFITAVDNTHLLKTFWQETSKLDKIRKENILDIIPELVALK